MLTNDVVSFEQPSPEHVSVINLTFEQLILLHTCVPESS